MGFKTINEIGSILNDHDNKVVNEQIEDTTVNKTKTNNTKSKNQKRHDKRAKKRQNPKTKS